MDERIYLLIMFFLLSLYLILAFSSSFLCGKGQRAKTFLAYFGLFLLFFIWFFAYATSANYLLYCFGYGAAVFFVVQTAEQQYAFYRNKSLIWFLPYNFFMFILANFFYIIVWLSTFVQLFGYGEAFLLVLFSQSEDSCCSELTHFKFREFLNDHKKPNLVKFTQFQNIMRKTIDRELQPLATNIIGTLIENSKSTDDVVSRTNEFLKQVILQKETPFQLKALVERFSQISTLEKKLDLDKDFTRYFTRVNELTQDVGNKYFPLIEQAYRTYPKSWFTHSTFPQKLGHAFLQTTFQNSLTKFGSTLTPEQIVYLTEADKLLEGSRLYEKLSFIPFSKKGNLIPSNNSEFRRFSFSDEMISLTRPTDSVDSNVDFVVNHKLPLEVKRLSLINTDPLKSEFIDKKEFLTTCLSSILNNNYFVETKLDLLLKKYPTAVWCWDITEIVLFLDGKYSFDELVSELDIIFQSKYAGKHEFVAYQKGTEEGALSSPLFKK